MFCRPRDPPGQRSVYVPPGDTAKESYRLSTFVKFPKECPANTRSLAGAGFYYTGYKDRVKCFSCGLCVENWTQEDDVTSSRWHHDDCQMILHEDCGNIPISKNEPGLICLAFMWLFVRIDQLNCCNNICMQKKFLLTLLLTR